MEQYQRGRGWELNETAKELHSLKVQQNKQNKPKLSFVVTADCSIFFLPCQTKTLPATASSSSPTLQFQSYSNVSQLQGAPPLLMRKEEQRAHRENEACKKHMSASLASATSFRLPVKHRCDRRASSSLPLWS